ncbi:hypothetical protein LI171_04830 [Emergencia timonensis]|uniref:hypothetical protein n=1 Tax=Emergencia timonensis TaxID=1776384 RepID=UPI001D08242A|nr:hypothetical protein [Emergencia timonensis]MCB6475562.1 hypothetical protein [Emergencia timonensis]
MKRARHITPCSTESYLVFLDGVCASALAAAVFEVLLVRPSLNTLDAAVAAFLEVCLEFFGISNPPFIEFALIIPQVAEKNKCSEQMFAKRREE